MMTMTQLNWDFHTMSDKELLDWLCIAIECKDKKYFKAIKNEMKRRIYE